MTNVSTAVYRSLALVALEIYSACNSVKHLVNIICFSQSSVITQFGAHIRRHLHICMSLLLVTCVSGPVLRPEFEQPDYTVPENDGPVEVCVVQRQALERDVVISLQTTDNSAIGTCIICTRTTHTQQHTTYE